MEKFYKEFLGLIQSAFTERTCSPSSEFDWVKAIDISKKHNIASILFYGAIKCNTSPEMPAMKELRGLTLQSIIVNTRQIYEIEKIETAFENEKIDYMPLKGIILKALYPQPEMRTMGDADILIKVNQYPAIEKIMPRLGYVFQKESDHELIWKKNTLFLELHKGIMTTYNKDFYRYFGDGWKIAYRVSNSCRYEMSAEDFYLYIFIHFTKHYRISGIGIKHLLDLWVYTRAHSDMNWKYITRELEKINMSQFHQNVLNTLKVWFDNGEETKITDLITSVIFKSGEYGSISMAVVNRALQNGKTHALKIKFDKVFHCIFLPHRLMKEKYVILKKAPILMPVMWIVRCFDILIHENDRLGGYMRRIKQVDSKRINENKSDLDAVGLHFHCRTDELKKK